MSIFKTEEVVFFDFNDLKSVCPKFYYDYLWQAYRIYDNSVCKKDTLVEMMIQVMCECNVCDDEKINQIIDEVKKLNFTAVHNGIF
jgi:mannitol/fructose-specific phosphotransferase system IIA component (Ntr-type)